MKPIVLISACLEFDKVRYNGQSIPSQTIRDLVPYVHFIKVCPEFEIGLGVPREPIRVVKVGEELRLIQHNTNRDLTDEMNSFSEKYIEGLGAVDGFIFKSRSPTMGVKNIKVYSGMKGSPVVDKCGGFFAGRIAEQYRGYPIEEDDRLRNSKIRDHFLTSLFLFARYRYAAEQSKLEEFNEQNKLLLEYYGIDGYGLEDIKKGMQKPPSREYAAIFFRKLIGDRPIIAKFEDKKASMETLKATAMELVDKDTAASTFFHPYPEQLMPVVDDERDYWK